MSNKTFVSLFIAAAIAATACRAETYYPEPSHRVKINLGATPWKFIKSDPSGAQDPAFNDATWTDVGIPHCWNDNDTYTNTPAGTGNAWAGMCWYRKHFTLDSSYAGRKIFVEFEGAHVGCAVYINGTFIPGNSAVNPQATHVIGFIPFIVDISDKVSFGGADNVLAVRISNNSGVLFADPNFSMSFRFGQNDGGLFRPVYMHITDKVYIPENVYSVVNKWGTCVGTVSAADASATVRIMTNVQNESGAGQTVALTTKVVDATNTVVLTKESSQAIAADSSFVFDQSGDIAGPHLWYPANSPWGAPYLYKVFHIVKVGGNTVDVFESPLGVRVITWDTNFPYINGHQHYLWGVASRYDYPALGSAIPEEQQWRDVKLASECGARLWRPGHSCHSPELTAACDAYGVMLVQPSGEGEGSFANVTGTEPSCLLKNECHRDMVVRDRNHPSILAWEVSNAGITASYAQSLKDLAKQWDPITQHPQSDRGYLRACQDKVSDLISCSLTGCEAGQKLNSLCTNFPGWGAEDWGTKGFRYDYDNELLFCGEYLQNWKNDIKANAFGLAQWYLAESPGETGLGRSFGTSAMDFSRIPKLLYHIYKACWIPYSVKPTVCLAHHWNRSGTVRVNAFSNCPAVRLLLNGTSLGDKVPNPELTASDDKTNTSTSLPYQCWWDTVTWAAGTLRAEGLDSAGNVVCFDEKKTAGNPDHVVLTVEPELVKPSGEAFQISANGSDCAFILATVVDATGLWCPTATNQINFSVSGPCIYRGGANQDAGANPGDPYMLAEGGMCKIAVKAGFTAGAVTVTATSTGLGQGTASFTTVAANPIVTLQRPVPGNRIAASVPGISVLTTGGEIRYFISKAAYAEIQVLDARGRLIADVPRALCAAGWHRVRPEQAKQAGASKGLAVYFFRCTLDNGYRYVKRLVVVR
ncbi:MAG TPA: glycoside hydrolase family 2 TIM barrel-domain containing protein [Chitinivibrionales bacterium]|nr:glycoside hydrolase family 2 TIM barrel-domain containing protein [Chitinivibrionales bacterium]